MTHSWNRWLDDESEPTDEPEIEASPATGPRTYACEGERPPRLIDSPFEADIVARVAARFFPHAITPALIEALTDGRAGEARALVLEADADLRMHLLIRRAEAAKRLAAARPAAKKMLEQRLEGIERDLQRIARRAA